MDEQIARLLREAKSADRIDRERAEMFTSMVNSPAWREYVSLLESKIQGFADVILGPSPSIDALVGSGVCKGHYERADPSSRPTICYHSGNGAASRRAKRGR